MKKRFLAGLLMLAMILALLPVSALAADTGSQPTSTTLRMKVNEEKTVSFDSGMEDLSNSPVSATHASVSVNSIFAVADAPVTDAEVPEGYYYIRGTRNKTENEFWSNGNLAKYGWGDKENLQWLTYTDKDNAAIYQVIDNGNDTHPVDASKRRVF